MSEVGITLEGLAAAVEMLRSELATWKALAQKQDRLTGAQLAAVNSGATAESIQQIDTNTASISQLAGALAGQVRIEYVQVLPTAGEANVLYLVPKSDGGAPNYCDEYLWINSAWELIGTTGAMAYNGELSIQVNGATVGTFTANQQGNTAVALTVPEDTSDLTNGAGFVDAAALATALAGKQDALNASQLTAVNSGITSALTTQITTNTATISAKQDALNASQLTAVNSGITSALVSQIGANQAEIATKANDADVVHLAGDETITGAKTFTSPSVTVANDVNTTLAYLAQFGAWTLGSTPASALTSSFRTRDSAGTIVSDVMAQMLTSGTNQVALRCRNTNGTNTYDRRVQLTVEQNGATALAMSANAVADLGTSSYKWKSLNGINPGALSLPNGTTLTDIAGDISNLDGALNDISSSITVNGWLNVVIPYAAGDYIRLVLGRTGGSTAFNNSRSIVSGASDNTYISIFAPVQPGLVIRLYVKATGGALTHARFYPCFGNA